MFVQAKQAKIMKAARPLASTPDHHTSSDDATSIGSPPRPDIEGHIVLLAVLCVLCQTQISFSIVFHRSLFIFSKFQGNGSAEELGLSSTQRTARTVIMVLRIGRISYTKLCVKPCHIIVR